MIFNSIEFCLFFFITAIIVFFIPAKYRWIWILLTSIAFYCYSIPAFIFVPAFIILVTYFGGIQIEKASTEKKGNQFYLFAIIANIGLLVFFNYSNFFSNTVVDIVNIFRSGNPIKNNLLINIIAPLGISYITFQSIGYLIEIKRANHPAEKHLGHFATYLLFFPKIIAGPVERAHNFLPQLKNQQPIQYQHISTGLKLILWGLFKKLVIADRLGIYVNVIFNNYQHHSGFTIIVATIFYVFQMYADFSGYTTMAIGISKILGFDIMENFNRPLLAKSVTEFWRKWHISLSTWFADYFYNPLAIEKRDWGKWAIVYASFVTFITLGFWHGANWTFIVFGAMQGFILSIEFFTRKWRKELRKKIPAFLNNGLGIVFTFSYFAVSLIFFRANSVTEAIKIFKRITYLKGSFYYDTTSMIAFCLLGILYLVVFEIKKEYFNTLFTISENKNWLVRNFYYCFLIMIILLTGVFDGGQFIYFQF